MAAALPDAVHRWHVAILLLAYCWSPALAVPAPVEICAKLVNEGRNVDSLVGCGNRWAVMNKARVTEFWEVHEMRLFWNEDCTVGVPNSKSVASSVMSTMLENRPHLAYDSDLASRWTANCRVLLGGCPPMAEWVGQETTGFTPINLNKFNKYANVRCVRIFQSPYVTRQASEISLVTWLNVENATDYHVVDDYHTFRGGVWQKRPALEHQLWRLWNKSPTERPWRVAGFMFYSDKFCTTEEKGVVVSSVPFPEPSCVDIRTCDKYNATNAVDGILKPGLIFPDPLPTYWMADCHWWNGCKEDAGWIGLDFGLFPKTVRCIRIWQPVNEAYPDPSPTFHSENMLLQAWDGYKWLDSNYYKGFGMGGWNDTRPTYKTAWRLSNFDKTPESWIVFEVAFYEDVECGSPNRGRAQEALVGLPISVNKLLSFVEQEQTCRLMSGSCSSLAFDKQTDTSWVSECTHCKQREAWIGNYFRSEGGTEVRCYKLWQSGELEHQSAAIELSYWSGDEWIPARHEIGLGGGTWNFRPAQVNSMFRVLSNSITAKPWTLIGFQVYNDTDCLSAMEGYPMVSGSHLLNPPDGAFDDDELTYWEASCSPPKPGALGCALNSAWIGIQGFKDAIEVRCVRIQQHRTRERQVDSMRSEEWSGMRWKESRTYPEPFRELSGGKWQMLPGLRGSMWRLAALPIGRVGFGVTELQFFRSEDCKEGLVKAAFPNVMPICSAFATAREVTKATGYEAHLRVLGDFGDTTPNLAFDDNQDTFWADLTSTENAWVGVDMTTQVTDVHCARISLAPIKMLQTDYAELQAWDGRRWATISSAVTPWTRSLPMPVHYSMGSGWQQRPSPPRSMWRIQNDIAITGWEIMELEFYMFVDCSGPALSGNAISSLPVTNSAIRHGGHRKPALVFDGITGTRWQADCKQSLLSGELTGTCAPGDAWIGLDVGQQTVSTCFRVIQSGRRYLQSTKIALAMWAGHSWEVIGSYSGFGGETWNRRPAAPDTLWRVSLARQKSKLCENHGRGLYMRSWGVSEVEFFSDDECKVKLPGVDNGATVIVSGTREPNTAIRAKTPQFDPMYAFDGSIKTYWAAQCGNRPGSDEAFCTAGFEWIGLDFSGVDGGQPRDVRCLKIHQNRNSRRECCDPAEEVKLERWNGTEWALAGWRHVPLNGAPIMTIDGRFERMGMCPFKVSSFLPGGNEDYWEERKRHQSEDCVIPMSASVKLLADPLCDKHQACEDAGFTGQCCPADENLATSRCCCDFLMSGIVFEDQLVKDAHRQPIETAPTAGLEYIIIRSVVVLPFLGLGVSFILLFLGNVPQPRPTSCLWRSWMAMCGPLQRWLTAGKSPGACVMAFFIIRTKGEKKNHGRLKMLIWLGVGFVGGGCVFWILISYVIAEVFIKFTVLLSMVVPLAKSPYSPGDPADRKRMTVMLAIPFDSKGSNDRVRISDSPLGDVASQAGATLVMWACYVLRAMFDFILMRFALLSIELVDVEITIPEILSAMPKLPIDIGPLQDLMYACVKSTTMVFQEAFIWLFEGVPRCEGPVVLFSGMWLVAVTLVLIRWLNYDIFGVFTSCKNVVSQTRPMFQKTCGIALMLGIQAALFLFMQCIMLIFVRALKLVNPMEKSNQQWTCPYGDDFMSVLVGRVLITCAAAAALVVTFLCANGHFLGQDYIVREYSQWIDMNLTGLDPDGVGDGGGFIRFDTLLAMIPTTLGIWIDGWNVRGYLIKERALVYAEEMELPVECAICECAHVPYNEVMRATGMQLSLAYQLAPAGAIIGKACEYLNNPPLFYFGTELKCFHARRHMKHAMEGTPKKLSSGQQLTVWCSLFCAFCKDCLFPFFVRLASLGLYITLVYMTFTIDKDNVKELAVSAFQTVSTLALSKAVLEFVLPAILLIIFFLIMRFSSGSNGAESRKVKTLAKKKVRNAWPVLGATMNGMAFGTGVALYLLLVDPMSFPEPEGTYAILIGSASGVLGCFVSLLLALILERCPDSRASGCILLFVYLVSSSFGFGWLGTSKHYEFVERMIMSLGVCLVLVSLSGYSFWPPTIPRGGPKAMTPFDPAILPLLNSPRLLSAPMGTVAGVFVTSKMHKMCLEWQGTYYGFGTAVLSGLIVSLIYALATDAIIEKRSSQLALGVGTFLSLFLGVYIEWWIGVFVGTVVGCILGAIEEHRTMKQIMAETILMVPGDAEPYKPSNRTDGTTLFPGQPMKIMDEPSNLPTLVTATPKIGGDELKNVTFEALGDLDDMRRSETSQQSQQLVMGTPANRNGGKRFGLNETKGSKSSNGATNMAWMPTSPTGADGPSPSSVAIAQGWVGNDGRGSQASWTQPGSGRSASSPAGSARQGNGSARRGQGSLKGAAQGGLPNTPGSGRQEPRQIASVVKAK